MSERPTPETDASRGYALTSHYGRAEGSYLQMDKDGPFVHAEVARKLERERDEARDKLCKVLQILDDYDKAIKNPSSPFWGSFKKWFTWESAK